MSPRAVLAWLWTLVILLLCWIPRVHLPKNERIPGFFAFVHVDKFVHMGIFLVWSYLWMKVAQPPHQGRRVFLVGVGLAILSELGQMMPFVHRDAGIADGLADILGVAVGMIAYLSTRKWLIKGSAQPEVS
jgi:VanZ family protein